MAANNTLDFNDLLQLIRDGEPVSAGTANRPLRRLDERTRYIWNMLRAAASGEAIFARQQTVEAGALQGMPVYWNKTASRFERGLAAAEFDATAGEMLAADSSQIWGVVYRKINSTLADIVLFGYVELDISAALATSEATVAGTYYLSRTTAGKLIRQRTPMAVPVLRSDGDGRVFVNPVWEDIPGRHSHVHFRLKATPSGDHDDPGEGERHVITSPNVHVEGWLPADHAIFEGNAPVNAKFGYNLSANATLKANWPPLPPEAAKLTKDGVDVPSGLENEDSRIVFDRNGIWWMTDCYNDVPWEPTVDTDYITTSESLEVSESPNNCPPPYRMRLDLYFTKLDFVTDASAVTSLVTNDNRIKIFCQGKSTVSAHVGPLEIALDLAFLYDAEDPGGFLAIKSFDAATQTFHFGKIASGVYSKSSNVILSGTATSTQSIDAVSRTVYHGPIGISVTEAESRELFADLVRLDGVTEEYLSEVMYFAFAAETACSYRGRIRIPESLDLDTPALTLKFRILGRVAGVLPALTVTARRIPKALVATALPTSDSAVVINTTATLSTTNQYIDIESEAFDVAAGDDVLFTVSRADDDEYAGEVGMLRISGMVAEAE